MRSTILLPALALAACAGTQTDDARTVQSCSNSECFRPSEIRRVEAIDDETLIVYAGASECPFRVEARGISCRLDFALDLSFVQREPGSPIVGGERRYRSPSRVCRYTPRVEVYTGIYDRITEQAVGGSDPFDQACRVANVEPMTDDELVELYVDRGRTPPPPPMGNGRLETTEQDEDEDAETPAGAPSGEGEADPRSGDASSSESEAAPR